MTFADKTEASTAIENAPGETGPKFLVAEIRQFAAKLSTHNSGFANDKAGRDRANSTTEHVDFLSQVLVSAISFVSKDGNRNQLCPHEH